MWGKTVDSFIQALDHREDWQGSLAIGPTWSDNLNQSSESVVTYRYVTAEETIVVKRSLPKAVSAHGQDFEATLNRRMAISGHHGMFVRSLLYGQAYEKESMYNESALISNAGYSYHDASNQYAIGPRPAPGGRQGFRHRRQYGAVPLVPQAPIRCLQRHPRQPGQ